MKRCTKCSEVKDYTKFSKCSRNKDGYQYHCKECNNKDNQKFRDELDPTYMKRWFKSHRKEWNEYCGDYARVSDTNTIYAITAPNGDVYVGFTQRKKRFRLSEHKKYYRTKANIIPLLYESFDRYGIDNHTVEILKQFKGSRSEGMELENKLINFYQSINKSLNIRNK